MPAFTEDNRFAVCTEDNRGLLTTQCEKHTLSQASRCAEELFAGGGYRWCFVVDQDSFRVVAQFRRPKAKRQ